MKPCRYRMLVEYDGTEFAGWQVQPGRRTVQGTLEQVLSMLTREAVKISAAGRTDSGVHATGQVCSFELQRFVRPEELIYRLARMLPKDVSVVKLTRTSADFDPRRQAQQRTYRYYISERPRPLLRDYSYLCWRRLDLERLNTAARLFCGEHDFGLFCRRSSRKANNRCRVFRSRWFRRNGLLIYEVTANRFLHHMIRRMVGLMLAYEAEKLDLTRFANFLNNQTKESVRFSVPAHGLVLVDITFGRKKNEDISRHG